jgi:hypothetical protein
MATSKTADAGKAKSTSSKSYSPKNRLEKSEIETYAYLRLVLDGFEALALHHFISGKDPEERKKRAKQAKDAVKAFQKKVMKSNKMAGCPKQFCDCDGVCVPCGFCPIEY